MVKFTALLVIMSSFWVSGFTQTTSFANASATILEPVSLTKTIDKILGGEVTIVSAKVTISPLNNGSKTNNITLPVASGIFTAAIFSLSGLSGYTYSFTIAQTPFTFKQGSKTMQITSGEYDPNLNAGTDMVAGVFVSYSPYNVTVNYN